jgi:hypothetical protein
VLIFSNWRLSGHSYWKLCQIFRRKINIREDKLLLYHCLLELGLPKVNVSEQACTGIVHMGSGFLYVVALTAKIRGLLFYDSL